MDLFDAYTKNMLPSDLGFVVSSYFSAHSAYSRYEIVSYNNVKSIYPADNGLTFQTDGKKLHILLSGEDEPELMYRMAHGIWTNTEDLIEGLGHGN